MGKLFVTVIAFPACLGQSGRAPALNKKLQLLLYHDTRISTQLKSNIYSLNRLAFDAMVCQISNLHILIKFCKFEKISFK